MENEQEDYKAPELHSATWAGRLEETEALIEAGADVNARDGHGETAIFGAAAWGRSDVVRLLISKGAEVNLTEPLRAYSPLHWAASHGNVETIRVLVEAGADPTLADRLGKLPVDVAHEAGKGAHVAYLKTVGPPIASR